MLLLLMLSILEGCTTIIDGKISSEKVVLNYEEKITELGEKVKLENLINIIISQSGREEPRVMKISVDKTNFVLIIEKRADQLFVLCNYFFRYADLIEFFITRIKEIIKSKKKLNKEQINRILAKIDEEYGNHIKEDLFVFLPHITARYFEDHLSKQSSLKQNESEGCILKLIETIVDKNIGENEKAIAITKLASEAQQNNRDASKILYNLLVYATIINDEFLVNSLFKVINSDSKRFGDYSKALIAKKIFVKDTELALQLIQDINEEHMKNLSLEGSIKYYQVKGAIYEKAKMYSDSIKEYYKTISLTSSKLKIIPEYALTYAGLANIQSMIGKHTQAINAYSLARSMFKYIGLYKQEEAMENNIYTIRRIQAQNYLATVLIYMNNKKYEGAKEALNKGMEALVLFVIETPRNKLEDVITAIFSLLEPIVLRSEIEKDVEVHMEREIQKISKIQLLARELLKGEEEKGKTISALKNLIEPENIIVHTVLIIYNDGRMIVSKNIAGNFEESKDQLFAGSLTAIQMLLEEALNTKGIPVIDAGDKKVLIEKGEYVELIVVTNIINDTLIEKTKQFMDYFEKENQHLLENWDGDMRPFEKQGNTILKHFI